jgi:hypothetical protein
MNDFTKKIFKKPDVPEKIKDRWQRTVDPIARVVGVPAGLTHRVWLGFLIPFAVRRGWKRWPFYL